MQETEKLLALRNPHRHVNMSVLCMNGRRRSNVFDHRSQRCVGHGRRWSIEFVHGSRLDLLQHNRKHIDTGAVTDSGRADTGATFSATGAGRTCSTITKGASTRGVVTHIGETGSAGRGDLNSTDSTVSANFTCRAGAVPKLSQVVVPLAERDSRISTIFSMICT